MLKLKQSTCSAGSLPVLLKPSMISIIIACLKQYLSVRFSLIAACQPALKPFEKSNSGVIHTDLLIDPTGKDPTQTIFGSARRKTRKGYDNQTTHIKSH